jgi:hypothetical protein
MAASGQWANEQAEIQHNGHIYDNRVQHKQVQINGVNLGNITPRANRVLDLGPYQLSDAYVDRAELTELKDKHKELDSHGDTQQRLRLCGMPGTGKTQLAIKFATDGFGKDRYAPNSQSLVLKLTSDLKVHKHLAH